MRTVYNFLEDETADGGVIADLDSKVEEAETYYLQRQIMRSEPVHPTEFHRKRVVLIISCQGEEQQFAFTCYGL